MPSQGELPFVDEHTVTIAEEQERVRSELRRFAMESLVDADHGIASSILGTDPRSGFAVAEDDADRLILVGRHRFSRYRLELRLTMTAIGTKVTALTYAEFPGLHGRVYRALVIGSGGHAMATNRILREVSKRTAARG